MPDPHLRAAPSSPLQKRLDREKTLEEMGIANGPLIATPEEIAEADRREAERVAKANDHMDAVLMSMWGCRCCGDAIANHAGGLCSLCGAVVHKLRVEAAMEDTFNGQSRRDLAALWLEAQDQAS